MASLVLATNARSAMADAITTLVGNAGLIKLFTAADAEVARLTLGSPLAGAAVAGVLTFNAITPDSDADGNASPITKFSLNKADGTVCMTGDVTLTGGGGSITMTNTTVAPGETVSCASATFTMPAGT